MTAKEEAIERMFNELNRMWDKAMAKKWEAYLRGQFSEQGDRK